MTVLMFISPATPSGEQVRAAVERTVLRGDTETFPTVGALIERLRDPLDARSVAVLLPATPEDLAELIEIREFLDDLRVILVLPEADESTVAQGHRLRPRVLLHGNDYLEQLLAILGNMIPGRPRRGARQAERGENHGGAPEGRDA